MPDGAVMLGAFVAGLICGAILIVVWCAVIVGDVDEEDFD